MKVTLERNGITKQLDTGFNVLYFFIGAWLPLFKGEIGKCFKHSILFALTLSIYYWIQSFGGYNKGVIMEHIDKGWKPLKESDTTIVNSL